MAPQVANHIMRLSGTKGGPSYDHKIHFPPYETTASTTTMKQMITTTINAVSSTVQEFLVPTQSQDGAMENMNTSFVNETVAMENTNSTNMDIPSADMNNTFNFNDIITSTGTSFEEVTTNLMDEMQMEHTGEEEHHYILFIILGVVLGILVLVSVVLGVIYNHYKKRGFQEISGDNHGSSVDSKSMKHLQQASSHDALLDKK